MKCEQMLLVPHFRRKFSKSYLSQFHSQLFELFQTQRDEMQQM